jgi:hypothetical protein
MDRCRVFVFQVAAPCCCTPFFYKGVFRRVKTVWDSFQVPQHSAGTLRTGHC